MKALIMGGTGAMGIHLCQLLADNGWEVYVTSRKERLNTQRITYIKGDAHNIEFLNSLMKNDSWDAIVDFMNYATAEFIERIGILLSSTKQYVFLSSSRVYANSAEPIVEDSNRILDVCKDESFLLTDDYSLAKARQENVLVNVDSRNWTIVRPYITFSENRLQLTSLEKEDWLYRAMKGKKIILSDDLLSKRTTLTYGHDVALAISKLMGQNDALGQKYHITSPHSITWYEVLDIYKNAFEDCFGYPMKVIITDKWKSYYGGDKAQVDYDRKYNRIFNTEKISKYIAKSELSDTKGKLRRCFVTFVRKPEWGTINWGKEALKDAYTHEWTMLSEIPSIKSKMRYLLNRIVNH